MPPALPQPRRTIMIAITVACAALLFASAAAAESRLYWINNASGSVATANRAGGEVIQHFFFASPEPDGITADSTHVYWTDTGTNEIGRAELSGANVEPSLIPTVGEVPEGIAVDAGHVYWANLVGQAIGRANLDGSEPEPNFIQLSAGSFPEGVAIEGPHVYWASAGHGGEIGRSNLEGGEVEEKLITGLGGAISALAANTTHLYWSTNVGVGRANIDGTEVNSALVTGQTSVNGVALDNEHVFWTSSLPFPDGRIGRAELDGGTPEPAFITMAEEPRTITVSKNATVTTGGAVPTTAVAGEEIEGIATVGGGESTSGTVSFSLFGPGDQGCAGDPLETFSVAVSGNGTYNSPAVTPTEPGTYHWEANYDGDSINVSSASSCQAGAFAVTAATPTLSQNASPGVLLGGEAHDNATLTGGEHPTGTVHFELFAPADPECRGASVFTSDVAASGAGHYESAAYKPTEAGTYHWFASYSGDVSNEPASAGCGAVDGSITVTQPATKTGSAVPLSAPAPGSRPPSAHLRIYTRAAQGLINARHLYLVVGCGQVACATSMVARVILPGLGQSLTLRGKASLAAGRVRGVELNVPARVRRLLRSYLRRHRGAQMKLAVTVTMTAAGTASQTASRTLEVWTLLGSR
jgi:hypothetical protein